jgi:hypothetical protein
MTDDQRIRDLEDALRPFAEKEYDSVVEEAWQENRELEVRCKGRVSRWRLDPADIKRAARVLRGR